MLFTINMSNVFFIKKKDVLLACRGINKFLYIWSYLSNDLRPALLHFQYTRQVAHV